MFRLSKQETELKSEIHAAVRAQRNVGSVTSKDVEDAQAAIAQLFNKIKDIKKKAEQSEASFFFFL